SMMAITQTHRDLELISPLGKDVLMVQSFTGTEAISQLFRFEMQLVSERTTVALDSLLGQKVTLRLNRDGGERYFNGYVHQFGKLTSAHGHDHYYVEVVPWLWFLTQTADSR